MVNNFLQSVRHPSCLITLTFTNSVQDIKSSEGVVIMFSLTSQSSFDNVPNIYESVKRIKLAAETDYRPKHGHDLALLLVGNKSDDINQRVLSTNDGHSMVNTSMLCNY